MPEVKEVVVDGKPILHPKDALDHKSREWEKIWAASFLSANGSSIEIEGLEQLFDDIRERVRYESLPPLTVTGLREALKSTKASAAMG
eukprot:6071931-Pyramimonas_sp.AAC.1